MPPNRLFLPPSLRPRAAIRRAVAAAVGLALAAGALTGCGGGASSPPPAHLLSVVATNFPLAQMTSEVGSNRVRVTDLASRAPDDRTIVPTPAQVSLMKGAALVVDVGGGYQPAVEKAAGSAPHVLSLRGPARGGAQFWLDPPAMLRAAGAVRAALSRIDAAGAKTYTNGYDAFASVMSTLSIDYETTLSDCPDQTMIAPNAAFGEVMKASALHVLTVAPGASRSTISSAASTIRYQSLPTVFSEPPLSDPALVSLAHLTHDKVRPLDTLDGPAPAPEPANYSYFNRMESDLGWIAGGLQCASVAAGGQ